MCKQWGNMFRFMIMYVMYGGGLDGLECFYGITVRKIEIIMHIKHKPCNIRRK